ncbi:MAG TPA: hypothetical protein VF486_20810 [Actinomycetes bacterium]
MTERYGFSFGEDDPASRRGPGITGQRGDEPPSPPRRADVREIDLTEDDEDERDLAEAEAAERVERLREATREEEGDRATSLFPPADERQDGAEGAGARQPTSPDDDQPEEAAEAADEAPQAYEVGSPVPAAAEGERDEEEARADGAATVDISALPDEVDEDADQEPSAGMALAPATPLLRSEGTDAKAVEAAAPEDAGAGTGVASAGATPAPRSGALLATDAEAVRRQFLDIQAAFVDEPRQAVEQASELVEALHQKVLESLDAEREQLDDSLAGDEPTTEDLRVALRAYRAYVDRLLGLHL